MELQDIWSKQDWESSEFDYESNEIQMELNSKSRSAIKQLLQLQWRGFYLSIAFLLLFGLMFLIKPQPDYALPLTIIMGCYFLLSSFLGYQLLRFKTPDLDTNLAEAIKSTLRLVQHLNRTQKKYSTIILPLSALGGYLLGLLWSGWSLQKLLKEPFAIGVIVVIMILMSLYGYRVGKFFSRKKCSQLVKTLKARLEELES